jgi:hypothetical protein
MPNADVAGEKRLQHQPTLPHFCEWGYARATRKNGMIPVA